MKSVDNSNYYTIEIIITIFSVIVAFRVQ